MSLKELKLSTDQRSSSYNPVTHRREVLVKNINRQISFILNQIEGIETDEKNPPKWYWMSTDGQYRCSVYYGRKAIQIEKGKFSFISNDYENLCHSLAVVRDLVIEGVFDSQIEAISMNVRKNFKK